MDFQNELPVEEGEITVEVMEAELISHQQYVGASETVKTRKAYEIGKRIVDIVGSLAGLILLSPVFALTAIAIKVEDGGSPIFAQTRVGKDGKFFRMYKFRSMCDGAERKLKELVDQNEVDGPAFKMTNDPRVTKVGAFIRKTSIDELPQLVNILKGEMSIVGPRPPLGHEVMKYNDYQMKRLSVKPGLTCYWQCSGRSDVSFDEWMDMDIKYIHERGFWKDIEIILKTIPAVLFHKGAY